MTDKYSREEGFLRLLAKSYLTHNADTLIKIIPDDFGYDSMWVFDSIKSKARYKEYITGKLESMKNGMYNVEFAMMKDKRDGKPLLMITNSKTPEGDHAVFVVTSDDTGNVQRLDLTSARFYPMEPMNENNVIKRTFHTLLSEYDECKLRFLTHDNREIDYKTVIIGHGIESAWGLAFVDDIPDTFGMVYDYSSIGPTNVGMFTPDTRIPVDFVFVDQNNKIIKIHKNAKPLSRDLIECKNVVFVIELKGGQCETNNIQVGDTVQLKSKSAKNKFLVPRMYASKPEDKKHQNQQIENKKDMGYNTENE